MATYIQNKGVTQTVFSNNNHKTRNEIKWKASYDGDRAKIRVNFNDNGRKNKYRMQLNNQDLANLLSIPAVNKPLESRLHQDFLSDFDFLDEEDIELLPQAQTPIQPIQIQQDPSCYKPRTEYSPESALFRFTIPDSRDKKEALKSQFHAPCPYNSDICSLPEITSLSSLKTLSSEPLTNQLISEPEPEPEPILKPASEEIARPRLTKREKNARLKTPSPKTLRIHYTTASVKGRGTRRKKKQNKFAKFFKKLF